MSIIEKSCGAGIYHVNTADECEFLLIQSRSDRHWGFSKGHMENTENEKETAIREIKEEVGLSVSFVEGFNETIAYDLSNGNHKQVTVFTQRKP